MYFVYIVKCTAFGFYYKGITNNLNRRIKEHESAKNKFTKRYLPIELVHVEIYASRTEARTLENFFKIRLRKRNSEGIILAAVVEWQTQGP